MNANGEHRHHPHCTASSPWMAFSWALESGLPPAAVFGDRRAVTAPQHRKRALNYNIRKFLL